MLVRMGKRCVPHLGSAQLTIDCAAHTIQILSKRLHGSPRGRFFFGLPTQKGIF